MKHTREWYEQQALEAIEESTDRNYTSVQRALWAQTALTYATLATVAPAEPPPLHKLADPERHDDADL